MRVSFTGPEVLTPAQHKYVHDTVELECEGWSEVTTGCAYGVDTVAFEAAVAGGVPLCRLVVPAAPHNEELVARYIDANPERFIIEHAPAGVNRGDAYMLRNDLLVFHCDHLESFPPTPAEVLRSGTWATIRRAVTAERRVHLHPLDFTGTVVWQ